MEVTIRFTGPLRSLAGRGSLVLLLDEGATLGDALLVLRDGVPPPFVEQVLAPVTSGEPSGALLMLNRALVSGPQALERPLLGGDVVAFVIPADGG